MGYTLIIAEKPNAAKRIASALAEGEVKSIARGGVKYYKIRRDGKELIVVPAVGHLFVLDSNNKEWVYPVFDIEWKPVFRVNKNNYWAKRYYENIKSLSDNAEEFISACDYDIEGSVIAYNILRYICKTERAKRMKFSTLTKPDLIEAYKNAMPELDFPQINAGLARHTLDWYFGINLSRALTLALREAGGYKTLSTGRVQGPTLKILEEREKEIASFIAKPFWQVEMHAKAGGIKFIALHEKEKFWDKEEAKKVMEKCKNGKAIVKSVDRNEYKQMPPHPFDLTTLQREAYANFGYSPKQTLDIAQALYEQALISYPRTSSQKLPAKIGYKKIIEGLSKQAEYAKHCAMVLAMPKLIPREGKKEDPAHPAIFPTGNKPTNLNKYQKNIYDIIVKRFLACFYKPALRVAIKIVIDIDGERFIASGARTKERGWMEIYGRYVKIKESIMPDLKRGDEIKEYMLKIVEKKTQPPKRYTQATILKVMEDLGLGTKATRAQILQTLYDRGYIKGKSIEVTSLGSAVVNALQRYCPKIISVGLTRRFEEEMEAIQLQNKDKEKVIEEAKEELKIILKEFKENEKKIGEDLLKGLKEALDKDAVIGKCECGGNLKITHSAKTGKRFVSCSSYPDCKISYPLPQRGNIAILKETCDKCGLHMISIKSKGKRAWKLCVKCGIKKAGIKEN
ncbi:MAG TPA: DNA topoisomerase I [Candidatus Aenigmarchaeota archaeon]|nr:DNA topoisomerase I [Candidatus Aenigmarchaeota archaeon]